MPRSNISLILAGREEGLTAKAEAGDMAERAGSDIKDDTLGSL